MSETVCPPQYLQIALDIATRIARGEFQENSRIYGRSVMSSEYGVSPETIRRSLKLLADMQVVDIKPQSGVHILSAENAHRYIERFGENNGIRTLQAQFKELIGQQYDLGRKLVEVSAAMVRSQDILCTAAVPFANYEASVPESSELIGKSLGELRFWQATGATIVAIRHAEKIVLSPGPYAQLHQNDVLIFVGAPPTVEAVNRFLGNQPG